MMRLLPSGTTMVNLPSKSVVVAFDLFAAETTLAPISGSAPVEETTMPFTVMFCAWVAIARKNSNSEISFFFFIDIFVKGFLPQK